MPSSPTPSPAAPSPSATPGAAADPTTATMPPSAARSDPTTTRTGADVASATEVFNRRVQTDIPPLVASQLQDGDLKAVKDQGLPYMLIDATAREAGLPEEVRKLVARAVALPAADESKPETLAQLEKITVNVEGHGPMNLGCFAEYAAAMKRVNEVTKKMPKFEPAPGQAVADDAVRDAISTTVEFLKIGVNHMSADGYAFDPDGLNKLIERARNIPSAKELTEMVQKDGRASLALVQQTVEKLTPLTFTDAEDSNVIAAKVVVNDALIKLKDTVRDLSLHRGHLDPQLYDQIAEIAKKVNASPALIQTIEAFKSPVQFLKSLSSDERYGRNADDLKIGLADAKAAMDKCKLICGDLQAITYPSPTETSRGEGGIDHPKRVPIVGAFEPITKETDRLWAGTLGDAARTPEGIFARIQTIAPTAQIAMVAEQNPPPGWNAQEFAQAVRGAIAELHKTDIPKSSINFWSVERYSPINNKPDNAVLAAINNLREKGFQNEGEVTRLIEMFKNHPGPGGAKPSAAAPELKHVTSDAVEATVSKCKERIAHEPGDKIKHIVDAFGKELETRNWQSRRVEVTDLRGSKLVDTTFTNTDVAYAYLTLDGRERGEKPEDIAARLKVIKTVLENSADADGKNRVLRAQAFFSDLGVYQEIVTKAEKNSPHLREEIQAAFPSAAEDPARAQAIAQQSAWWARIIGFAEHPTQAGVSIIQYEQHSKKEREEAAAVLAQEAEAAARAAAIPPPPTPGQQYGHYEYIETPTGTKTSIRLKKQVLRPGQKRTHFSDSFPGDRDLWKP